jgi:hypothetical protein
MITMWRRSENSPGRDGQPQSAQCSLVVIIQGPLTRNICKTQATGCNRNGAKAQPDGRKQNEYGEHTGKMTLGLCSYLNANQIDDLKIESEHDMKQLKRSAIFLL